MSRSPRTSRRRFVGVGPQLQVSYIDSQGLPHHADADQVRQIAFEDCLPVRVIPKYAGQLHTPGRYWSASTGEMLGYESHLEARWMTLLDFDPQVIAFSAQPMLLDGVDTDGAWRHTPDLFARHSDGSGEVIDVKNPLHLNRPDVMLQARRTEAACQAMGLGYRMVGDVDGQLWTNVSWLAGYRRPLNADPNLAEQLLALAVRPVSISDLLSFTKNPLGARPVVFHLCWQQRLIFDLAAPLREATIVRAATTVAEDE